ncbi:PIN domain-containing protein [Hyphomonas sp.]|uniref:PIN domain-containing protein n=1 Tax=Hyphomonas sp. TaxID=87 RepID=UPI0037C121BD
MACIIDTNVAIHLRDGDAGVSKRLAELGDGVLMSIVTRVELEGGVYRVPEYAAIRRARLDVIIAAIPALAFDDLAAGFCANILAEGGYSRRKILDRMIAAQALAHRATLITMNAQDFSDIPGLYLLDWS